MVSNSDFGRTDTIPGQPGKVPGTPGKVPSTPNVLGTAQPGGVNILANDHFVLKAGAVSMEWTGFVALQTRVNAFEKQMIDLRHVVCQNLAQRMEAWAKENAPWQDRTGNARRQLRGEYIAEDGEGQSAALIINEAHEERQGGPHYYAEYLETMQGGAFAIVFPTIIHFAEELKNIRQLQGPGEGSSETTL